MKYITIILLLISLSAAGQTWKTEVFQPDKAMHLTMSAMLTALGTETAKDLHFKNPELVGVAFSLSAGMLKEFVLDKGNSDAFDLGTNILGSFLGVPLNRMFNKWEMKTFYKNKNPNYLSYGHHSKPRR
jgi:uncharacterized protein YfiM (DUF2279 family)